MQDKRVFRGEMLRNDRFKFDNQCVRYNHRVNEMKAMPGFGKTRVQIPLPISVSRDNRDYYYSVIFLKAYQQEKNEIVRVNMNGSLQETVQKKMVDFYQTVLKCTFKGQAYSYDTGKIMHQKK